MTIKSELYCAVNAHSRRMAEDRTVPPRNLHDFLRLLGYDDANYNLIRHRLEPNFDKGGDLHELVEFGEGHPPKMYAEPHDKFSRVKLTRWEKLAIEAKYTVVTTESEPTVQDEGLLTQLRMICEVRLAANAADYRRAARLVAEHMERDEATQVLAVLLSVGETAAKVAIRDEQVVDLRGHVKSEQERVADMKLLMAPAAGRRRPVQPDEEQSGATAH